MAEGSLSDGRFPPEIVVSDDDPSRGYFTIIMTIPKMRVKSSWKGVKRIIEVENGKQKIDINNESVSVHIQIQDDGKTMTYSYVKKLPEDVIPIKCDFKLKKEQVRLTLRKKENNSWGQHSSHFMKRS
ncbi:hypothetical protein LSH36_785g02003 [Paralvinella palmiformis]|uniref:CS domain-containing protein n=1 Tax=Paralvinella palmiformis TaxID=53620 RepID=A0AAD9IZZ5_9ANNE|nr:hypothetical protein LSH36_785g02003 [Paralvinella palmiformis]